MVLVLGCSARFEAAGAARFGWRGSCGGCHPAWCGFGVAWGCSGGLELYLVRLTGNTTTAGCFHRVSPAQTQVWPGQSGCVDRADAILWMPPTSTRIFVCGVGVCLWFENPIACLFEQCDARNFSGKTTKNPWTVSVHGGVTVHPRGWVTVLPGSLEVRSFLWRV